MWIQILCLNGPILVVYRADEENDTLTWPPQLLGQAKGTFLVISICHRLTTQDPLLLLSGGTMQIAASLI